MEGIEFLPSLQRIDLRGNRISSTTVLRPLSSWRHLKVLSVGGNPVTSRPGFPVFVSSVFSEVTHLDCAYIPGKRANTYRVVYESYYSRQQLLAQVESNHFSWRGFFSSFPGHRMVHAGDEKKKSTRPISRD